MLGGFIVCITAALVYVRKMGKIIPNKYYQLLIITLNRGNLLQFISCDLYLIHKILFPEFGTGIALLIDTNGAKGIFYGMNSTRKRGAEQKKRFIYLLGY